MSTRFMRMLWIQGMLHAGEVFDVEGGDGNDDDLATTLDNVWMTFVWRFFTIHLADDS